MLRITLAWGVALGVLAVSPEVVAQECPGGTFLCFDFSGCCPFGTFCGTGFNGCSADACCSSGGGGGGGGGSGGGGGGGFDDDDDEPVDVEVCENTCGTAFDGVCQDGQDEAARCAYGSDCQDCGPRVLLSNEIGGCRAASASSGALLLLVGFGLLAVRRRRAGAVAGALLAAGAVTGLAAPAEASAFELDLAPGVVFGGAASPTFGAAEVGPRLRLGVHWDANGDFLLGAHVGGELTGRVGRVDAADIGLSQIVGGRGRSDAGLLGCYGGLGPRGLCVTLGGFGALSVDHYIDLAGDTRLAGAAGPMAAVHFSPRIEQGALRGPRLEIAVDLVRDRVEARLGFEL